MANQRKFQTAKGLESLYGSYNESETLQDVQFSRKTEIKQPNWISIFNDPQKDGNVPSENNVETELSELPQELSIKSKALYPNLTPLDNKSIASFDEMLKKLTNQKIHINTMVTVNSYIFFGTSQGQIIRLDMRTNKKSGSPLDAETIENPDNCIDASLFFLNKSKSLNKPLVIKSGSFEVTSMQSYTSVIDIAKDPKQNSTFEAEFDRYGGRLYNIKEIAATSSLNQQKQIKRRCRRVLAGYSDGSLRYWDYSNKKCLVLARGYKYLRKLMSSNNPDIDDYENDEDDEDDDNNIDSDNTGSHKGSITSICTPSTDNYDSRIYTGGSDGELHMWDLSLSARKPLWCTQAHEMNSSINSIIYSNCAVDCVLKYSGKNDINVEKRINPYHFSNSNITTDISPGVGIILTTGSDRTTKVWLSTTGKCVSVFEHPTYEVLSLSNNPIIRTTEIDINLKNKNSYGNVFNDYIRQVRKRLNKKYSTRNSKNSDSTFNKSVVMENKGREYINLDEISDEVKEKMAKEREIEYIHSEESILENTKLNITVSLVFLGCSDGYIRCLDLFTQTIIHEFELPRRIQLSNGKVENISNSGIFSTSNIGKPKYKAGFGTMKNETLLNNDLSRKPIKGSRGGVTSITISTVNDKIYSGDTFGFVYEWDLNPIISLARTNVLSTLCDICVGKFVSFKYNNYLELEHERRSFFNDIRNGNVDTSEICECACYLPLIPPSKQNASKIFEPHSAPIVLISIIACEKTDNKNKNRTSSNNNIEDFNTLKFHSKEQENSYLEDTIGTFNDINLNDTKMSADFGTMRRRGPSDVMKRQSIVPISVSTKSPSRNASPTTSKLYPKPIDIRYDVKSALSNAELIMESLEINHKANNMNNHSLGNEDVYSQRIRLITGSIDGCINDWYLDEQSTLDDEGKPQLSNVIIIKDSYAKGFDLPIYNCDNKSKNSIPDKYESLKSLHDLRTVLRDNVDIPLDRQVSPERSSLCKPKVGINEADKQASPLSRYPTLKSSSSSSSSSLSQSKVFNYVNNSKPINDRVQKQQASRNLSKCNVSEKEKKDDFLSILPSSFLRKVSKFLNLYDDDDDDIDYNTKNNFGYGQVRKSYDSRNRAANRIVTRYNSTDISQQSFEKNDYLPFVNPNNAFVDPAIKFLSKEISTSVLKGETLLHSLEKVRNDGNFDNMVRETNYSFLELNLSKGLEVMAYGEESNKYSDDFEDDILPIKMRCWEQDSEWDSDDGSIIEDYGLYIGLNNREESLINIDNVNFDETIVNIIDNHEEILTTNKLKYTNSLSTNIFEINDLQVSDYKEIDLNSDIERGLPMSSWWDDLINSDDKENDKNIDETEEVLSDIENSVKEFYDGGIIIEKDLTQIPKIESIFITPSSSNRDLYSLTEENEE